MGEGGSEGQRVSAIYAATAGSPGTTTTTESEVTPTNFLAVLVVRRTTAARELRFPCPKIEQKAELQAALHGASAECAQGDKRSAGQGQRGKMDLADAPANDAKNKSGDFFSAEGAADQHRDGRPEAGREEQSEQQQNTLLGRYWPFPMARFFMAHVARVGLTSSQRMPSSSAIAKFGTA